MSRSAILVTCRMRFTLLLFASMLMLPGNSYGTSLRPLPNDGSLLVRQCQTTIKVIDAGRDASEQDILPAQFCGDDIKGYADALIAGKRYVRTLMCQTVQWCVSTVRTCSSIPNSSNNINQPVSVLR